MQLVESESLILRQREAVVPQAARTAAVDVDIHKDVVEVPQAAPRGAAAVDQLPAGPRLAPGNAGGAAAVEEVRRHGLVLQEVVHVRRHHYQVVVLRRRWPCYVFSVARRAVVADVFSASAVARVAVVVSGVHDLAALLQEPRPRALDVLGRRRFALLEVRPPVVLDLVVRPAGEATRDRRPSSRLIIVSGWIPSTDRS